MNTKKLISAMMNDANFTALKLLVSVGIYLETTALEFTVAEDSLYSEEYLLNKAAEFHGYSVMLHEMVEKHGDQLRLMICPVPDGMVAVRVKNPLYQHMETTDDPEGSSVRSTGADDFPF